MMRWILLLLFLVAGPASLSAAPVTFADRLQAKFHHERCLSCHQFNSRENNGRAFTSHRSRYMCLQCHRPERIGLPPGTEWMAPNKMDYTGFSAAATCRLIKQRMGSDAGGQKLVNHLINDGRIRWALDSGMTPAGKTTTVPGGYDEWKRDVEDWVRDGMRCD